ncbi:hypothetical protein E2562_021358 [Oryza meyeriana var. granulata]|uniref:DUF4219 domain-containing protein n=1 Tax=Oryza meyeriana var. granulata TaxID=110450 RepID=A0A6G1CHM1_9ORYZ|nr:hypothetical protein E2562_021358 [Oryza meyeriana var. granulata]
MKVFMQAQDVWDAVEPVDDVAVDPRMDKMALAAIYQGIPEETLLMIAEKETAEEAWTTLKTMHLGDDQVKNAKNARITIATRVQPVFQLALGEPKILQSLVKLDVPGSGHLPKAI